MNNSAQIPAHNLLIVNQRPYRYVIKPPYHSVDHGADGEWCHCTTT